jgi:mRNA-degrading endonuclease RelE of RelBE toxin-antitoxin system
MSAPPYTAGVRRSAQKEVRALDGDYRVIYTIDDAGRLVEIDAVRHRSKAYE